MGLLDLFRRETAPRAKRRESVLFDGRFAASIDDVKATALSALRHRVLLSFEGEAEGVAADRVITEILKKLPGSKE